MSVRCQIRRAAFDRGRLPVRSSRRRPTIRYRGAAVAVSALLAGGALAACSSGGGGGPFTLNFYSFPDNSGAIQTAVDNCSKASGGQYTISYNKLPTSADGQRQQLVRRLAAHDSALDILGLDVTWEAEFAEAGWIRDWTGANRTAASNGTLQTSLNTATWKGKLVAVPYNTNTQLLWYRADLVPKPPKTWAEMISMATNLAHEGKPHYIEIQGAQYEGLTVWFNTLVASAGGSILNKTSTAPSLGQPAIQAVQTMRDLANSPAKDPSISVQQEDQNRLAMEAGTAAFELNYPFVYPSMLADKPNVKTYNGKSLADNFKWTAYPTVKSSEHSHVTIGGIDLAVSQYSPHPEAAFKAALCLRNKQNQLTAAVVGGLPPTIESIYKEPNAQVTVTGDNGKPTKVAFKDAYPMYQAIYDALKTASVRPKTPAYQSVSIVISHTLSPPGGQDPTSAIDTMKSQIQDALDSKGLIP
jgi:multiple sugar transport system substrate-binding protein